MEFTPINECQCWQCGSQFPVRLLKSGMCPECFQQDSDEVDAMLDFDAANDTRTEEDIEKEHIDAIKCSDYIAKHNISPNLDSIY